MPEEPGIAIRKEFPYCGVNYYPKNHAWHMWDRAGWNSEIIPNDISEELKVTKNLGVNLTRIFINYKDFGEEKPSLTITEISYLKRYLDMARDLNINVIITLFDDCSFNGTDVKSENSVVSNQNAIDHTLAMVKIFQSYKNIVAWDLINEPDGKGFFDFDSGQWNTIGLNWLVNIFDALNADLISRESSQRITLGTVMGTSILTEVANRFPGIIPQIHQYTPYTNNYDFYNKVKGGILELYNAFNEPIFIGEFGCPASITNAAALETQANIYKTLLKAVDDNKEKVHSVANWTLYDFPKVHNPERYFGIITEGDALKPSAEILKEYYLKWQEES